MMLQSGSSLYLIIFIILFLWVHVFSQHGFFVTRTNMKDELKPDNCSTANRAYSTKNCHTVSTVCQGSCICLNGTTLLVDQKNELQCEGSLGKDNVCHYAPEAELSKKKFVTASTFDLGHMDKYVGKVLLKNGGKLKKCIIHGDKSTFWNITQWSPLFTDSRKISDIYFVHGFSILFLKKGSHMEEAYKGLLINLTIQCDDEAGNLHPKSCVMFKVSGKRKYTVGSKTDIRTKITTTEAPPSELEGSVVISIGIAAPIVLILLIAVAVYYNKRRKMSRKYNISGPVPTKPPRKSFLPQDQGNVKLTSFKVLRSPTMNNNKDNEKKLHLAEDSERIEGDCKEHHYMILEPEELTERQSDDDSQRNVETSFSKNENSYYETPCDSTIPVDNNNINATLGDEKSSLGDEKSKKVEI